MADKYQLKAIITGVDRLSPALQGIQKKVASWRKQMERTGLGNIGISDIIQGGSFAAPFVAGAKAAIEFESAMADVRKVVDFDTPQQFKEMGQDIARMSTRLPMAAKDIAAIVASGGQAGIARDELAKFAEAAVKMGIAFDQTAAQSGEMMAKWRTAFRLTQDEVVSLADKVNYLSNNGPASAQQIAGIVTAIGPLGEVAGLASGQIAAMGATLAGVGVKEEVAATGLKNFMLTLTAGTAATKAQQQVFRALRMDSSEVAKSMQQDAQGTMVRMLTAISKVDKARQAAVLTQLFGRESIGAIAPMLTNLELLRKNLGLVGGSAEFAGSMEKEFTSRAATTANMLLLLRNKVVATGQAIGDVLIPSINRFGETVGPMIDRITEVIRSNPELIKGIVGAALAFTGLRVSVMLSIAGMKMLGSTIRLAGTAAKVVAPAVKALATVIGVGLKWAAAVGTAAVNALSFAVGVGLKAATFVGGLAVNGMTVVLGALRVAALATGAAIKAIAVAAVMTPIGRAITGIALLAAVVIKYWEPIKGFAERLWGGIKSRVEDAGEVVRSFATFSPLGMIIQNWEPIVAWFRDMVGRVGKLLEPITNGAAWIKGKVGGWFGDDAPAAPPARESIVQQAAAANRTNLQGAMVVRFENAPQGMRAEPAQTNQPALSITPQVGYRSLAMGGAR